ncbi:SapC family protein [Candidatus Methylobacter oryzae]|uniref:SapC family protein n=1 Tax=Candidatus Methylobacter oryzae TaxID=2497749 RepID=A0ABY3C8Y9_9GAMM|nr:SapC family protein [Candidatus Methylobacter oryzae]TRW92017.1 SapC family protein [Candidatus Methylobacter oryzae]
MYKTPEVLNKDAHGKLTYTGISTYEFARGQTTAPLLSEEIAEASAYYPIVFAIDNLAKPLALLGLRDQNVYIDEAGHWTVNYIPAFIRRYPFVFATGNENTELLHLAIDATAPQFAGQGESLFTDDGEPSAIATGAMKFLTAYQTSSKSTEALHQPLLDSGVLVAKTLTQQIDNEMHAIGGFSVVDEEKFKALPDETLAQWARSGLLATVYAHWASLRHLQKVAMASSRPETPTH